MFAEKFSRVDKLYKNLLHINDDSLISFQTQQFPMAKLRSDRTSYKCMLFIQLVDIGHYFPEVDEFHNVLSSEHEYYLLLMRLLNKLNQKEELKIPLCAFNVISRKLKHIKDYLINDFNWRSCDSCISNKYEDITNYVCKKLLKSDEKLTIEYLETILDKHKIEDYFKKILGKRFNGLCSDLLDNSSINLDDYATPRGSQSES